MSDELIMKHEQINAMLDGLDGVTPGPWSVYEKIFVGSDDLAATCETVTDAAHIARCDPDTIRALCELALKALRYEAVNPSDFRYWEGRYRDEAAANDALRAENERLRSALEEIASGKYSGIALPTYPPQDPSVNRARRALERKPE
jgi:hypothetical protein